MIGRYAAKIGHCLAMIRCYIATTKHHVAMIGRYITMIERYFVSCGVDTTTLAWRSTLPKREPAQIR